jgi:hypothetical protein
MADHTQPSGGCAIHSCDGLRVFTMCEIGGPPLTMSIAEKSVTGIAQSHAAKSR